MLDRQMQAQASVLAFSRIYILSGVILLARAAAAVPVQDGEGARVGGNGSLGRCATGGQRGAPDRVTCGRGRHREQRAAYRFEVRYPRDCAARSDDRRTLCRPYRGGHVLQRPRIAGCSATALEFARAAPRVVPSARSRSRPPIHPIQGLVSRRSLTVSASARCDRPARLDHVAANAGDDVVQMHDDADVVRNDPHALADRRAPCRLVRDRECRAPRTCSSRSRRCVRARSRIPPRRRCRASARGRAPWCPRRSRPGREPPCSRPSPAP